MRTRTVPPDGIASAALRIRFHNTWRSCPAAASIPLPGSALHVDVNRGRARLELEHLGDLGRQLAQIQRLALLGVRAARSPADP